MTNGYKSQAVGRISFPSWIYPTVPSLSPVRFCKICSLLLSCKFAASITLRPSFPHCLSLPAASTSGCLPRLHSYLPPASAPRPPAHCSQMPCTQMFLTGPSVSCSKRKSLGALTSLFTNKKGPCWSSHPCFAVFMATHGDDLHAGGPLCKKTL